MNRLLTFLGLPVMAVAAMVHRSEADASWLAAGAMAAYLYWTIMAMYYIAKRRP